MPVPQQRPAGSGRSSPIFPRLVDHRQPEPRPQIRTALADALEKAEVLGEAAERDVLAVVRRRLGIAVTRRERLHRAAERRTRLVEDDLRARVHELERRGEPREAAADDCDLHRKTPRATTASFAGVESRVLPWKTSKSFASIRSSVER